MKEESEPITDDEWLLRRVHLQRFRTAVSPYISPGAFEPRGNKSKDPDTEGISLYREACLSNPTDILATVAEAKRGDIGIVRVSVSFLKSLQLSVQCRPDPRVAGHVVIPELNAVAYDTAKITFVPIQLKLAEHASEPANILRDPHHAK